MGLVFVLTLLPGVSAAYQLSLLTTDETGAHRTQFDRSETITLSIVIVNADGVAATAFTLNYPAEALQAPPTNAEGAPVNVLIPNPACSHHNNAALYSAALLCMVIRFRGGVHHVR